MVKCPNCAKTSTVHLMDFKMPRIFDEEKQLPITTLECKFCNTEIKFIGPVCINCGGTGKIEKKGGKLYSILICAECKGNGCHPQYIEIEWGKELPLPSRIRSHYEQDMFDEGMHAFNQRQAVRQHHRGRGNGQIGCRGGHCRHNDTTTGETIDIDYESIDYRHWKGGW